MRWTYIFLFILIVFTCGCDIQQRKRELNEKEIVLNEKEQRLLLKERTLEIKEQELTKRQQKLDSLQTDSTNNFNPAIIGKWTVKMNCTLATCPGSAVGDTKTEVWNISFAANKVIVNALAADKLVRAYYGTMTNNNIELEENPGDVGVGNNTRMIVRLQMTDSMNMIGEREITRDNECRVVYSLQLAKQ